MSHLSEFGPGAGVGDGTLPSVDPELRRDLAADALRGYVSGPDAVVEATEAALARASEARAVILVEGVSDQIAIETLAYRMGCDLSGDGVVVVPIGGAHGITRFLVEFGPRGRDLRLAGLCDRAEADSYRRGLDEAGLGPVEDVDDMARVGFHVCTEDLEDELIRALGRESVETLLESQGDLGSFQTLQKQPHWRDRSFEDQVRRFFGAGARRKSRYARRMIEALVLERVPSPLVSVLARVMPVPGGSPSIIGSAGSGDSGGSDVAALEDRDLKSFNG